MNDYYELIGHKNVIALYGYGIAELDTESISGDLIIRKSGTTTIRELLSGSADDLNAVAQEIIRLGAVDAEDEEITVYSGEHDGEDVTVYAPGFWD